MKKVLLPLLLFLGTVCSAQTFSTNTSFACNQQVCNGIPLDQGGTWQFIEGAHTFSLENIDASGTVLLDIYGNPGNPLTYYPSCTYVQGSCTGGQPGGMYNVVDKVPQPPNLYLNGSTGVSGTLTFDFEAISSDGVTHYFGHASVQGHRVRHFAHGSRGSGGYYTSFVVESAEITIDKTEE